MHVVERRTESRTKAQQPATLRILGREGAGGMPATLEDFSDHGIRLRTPAPVPGNAAVQVETESLLILGDVCRCTRVEEGGEFYHVAVKVAHRLSALKPHREPALTRA